MCSALAPANGKSKAGLERWPSDSLYHSCGEYKFSSQNSHGGSQLSVTSIPVNLMPSSDLQWHTCAHIHTCRENNHTYKILKNQKINFKSELSFGTPRELVVFVIRSIVKI